MKKVWVDDVVEFRGEYYNVPPSIIGPKPTQKPHIPIYLGGFSPNTFARIVKYDINGWLGGVSGPLEHLENTINALKDNVKKANKDRNNSKIILLTFPNIVDPISQITNEESQRFLLTGTIDQIGHDIKSIKDMGIDHIILSFNFLPIGKDIDSLIDKTKQLSKFAR